jgi:hypothetical protein
MNRAHSDLAIMSRFLIMRLIVRRVESTENAGKCEKLACPRTF